MFWQSPDRQSPYQHSSVPNRELEVPDVLPSDVLRQVLYPAAGLCMVVTIYAVAFYHSRVEQPTFYPSEMNLPAVLTDLPSGTEMVAGAGVLAPIAGGTGNDCPAPVPDGAAIREASLGDGPR